MEVEIRLAEVGDAWEISQVIIAALRTTNAKDYAQAVIEQVERSFSPSAVTRLLGTRTVFVALQRERVVGTTSLDGCVIRTVFVHPDLHGKGIGRKLMNTVEQAAHARGFALLQVPSSVSAEYFYVKLGYSSVREVINDDERTIVMERRLPAPAQPAG